MGIGVWQVILILVVVLIIFGAGKLPRVAGDLAKGIKNFKTGMKEADGIESSTSSSASDDESSQSVANKTAVSEGKAQDAAKETVGSESANKG